MSLENSFERIADALEALVAKIGTAAELPAATLEEVTNVVEQVPLSGKATKPETTTQPPIVPQNTAPPADVELDKEGLSWDGRIHSGSKAKLVNGNWKKMRGVDAGLVAQVEAELRAAANNTVTADNLANATQQPAGAMSLADLQIAAQDVVRQLGPRLNEVAAVLQKYGASELSGLAAEHYANFLTEIQALLTPA